MKLYDGGRAPNPRRVQIFLAEKGLEIEKVPVDINALDQRSEEFTQKNPLQRVPVLELDDGTHLAESIAICRYLETLHPDPPLFGTDPLDQAVVEMWQRRVELGLMMPIAFSFRHLHPGASHLESPQIPEWGEVNKPRAIEFMKILDRQLGEHPYIAGPRFTVADITAIVALQFLKPARIQMPDDLPNLANWFSRVLERPSVAL